METSTHSSSRQRTASGLKYYGELELSYECHASFRNNHYRACRQDDLNQSIRHHWIVRDNHFSIRVKLSFQHSMSDAQNNSLLGDLVKAIATTKIWEKLNLVASIVRDTPSSLCLFLVYDELTIGGQDGGLRMPIGYTSNLKPPESISVLHLTSIDLDLTLKRGESEADIQSPTSSGSKAYQSTLDDGFCSLEDIFMRETDFSQCFSQNLTQISSQALQFSQPSRRSSFTALDDYDSDNSSNSRETIQPETQKSLSIPQKQPRPTQDQCSSSDNTRAMSLVESVIRSDLLGAREIEKIRSADRDIESSLPRICPVLFSPGYLKAMNERSQFVSSITRSLKGITSRARTQEFAPSLTVDLEGRLWLLAQAKLLDLIATAKLPPLFERSEPRKQSGLSGGRRAQESRGLDDECMLDDGTIDEFQDLGHDTIDNFHDLDQMEDG